MAPTNKEKIEHFEWCTKRIKPEYSVDSTKLSELIDAIKTIETLTEDGYHQIAFNAIRSSLTGKVRDYLPENIKSFEDIINALKTKTTYPSDKVIKDKISSLKIINNDLHDFAKKGEELTDQLLKILKFKGISSDMAQEMAIEETIKMCRANAKNDKIDTILLASTFKTPAEIISKFVTSTTSELNDRQILAFQVTNSNFRGRPNNFYSNRGGQNNFRGSFRENYQNYRGSNQNFRGKRRGGFQPQRGNFQPKRGRYNYNGNYYSRNQNIKAISYTPQSTEPQPSTSHSFLVTGPESDCSSTR